MNVTAVMAVMNEEEFVRPCIAAIYPFVTRLIVVTNFDRDYYGQHWEPDRTVAQVLEFDDPDEKIVLLTNRALHDETVQRNWAIASDREFFGATRRSFRPHGRTAAEIRTSVRRTDWYWIVDADEIYDPDTIPQALDYVARTRAAAVLVRGHNFFKTWNYMIDPQTDYFCQIGFVRPGKWFSNRRNLYFPRPLGWIGRVSPRISRRLSDSYCRQVRMPPAVAHFYHGSYVGDEARIRRKLLKSSHRDQLSSVRQRWLETTWRSWTSSSTDFCFPPNERAWRSVEHVPTSKLPRSIVDADWPPGWIERL